MTKKKNSTIDFSDLSLNSTEIPELDAQTANQLLNNVFKACDMEPSSIPVEVLESWGNYKKPPLEFGRTVSYVVLVIMVLLPLQFFHPTVTARRVNVASTSDAVYDISVKTLIPISTVSAELNGKPVTLQQKNKHDFTTTLTENGTLSITAVSMNGQETTQTYEVTHLDTDKPQFIQSYTQGDLVYLVVRDTYSGIDYDNISGLTPRSIDTETGTIAFTIPEEPQTVTIPDKARNELMLLISPVTTE